jgi:hypothetical protein
MPRSTEKKRHDLPNCEGRWGDIRALFHERARELKKEKDDPLYRIITQEDVVKFVDGVFEGVSSLEPKKRPFLIKQYLSGYSLKDQLLNSQRDIFRGDPLDGDLSNIYISLIPFVYEALRETLRADVKKASLLFDAYKEIEIMERGGNANQDLLSKVIGFSIEDQSHEEIEEYLDMLVEDLPINGYALSEIANRDISITTNSMNTRLLTDYAELYVDKNIASKLDYFHTGVNHLEKELGIDITSIGIPSKKSGCEFLDHSYYITAEFGVGPDTKGLQVGSAPYRIFLFKDDETPVLGMSFYIRNDNALVLYQVQEMSSNILPEGVSIGDAGIALIENIAKNIGFEQIVTYSHHRNPVRFLYPGDSTVSNALKINFDEAIKRSPSNWEQVIKDADDGRHGRIDGYILKL